MNNLTANFNLMTIIARRVGNALLRDFTEVQNLTVSVGGTEKIAKRARRRAEKGLRYDLMEARPNYGIRGDLNGIEEGSDPTREWLITGISAFENFRNGIPHWAVGIALRVKNTTQLAVLYDPYKNEMFRSHKGQGAYINNVRLRSSSSNNPRLFLVATDRVGQTAPVNIGQLASSVQSVRCSGAPALDLAYLAAGRLHAFIGTDRNATDQITAEAILLESGGMIGPVPSGNPDTELCSAAGTNGYDVFNETLAMAIE